jgi:hypothetical protein
MHRRLGKAAAVLASFAISIVFGYLAVRGVKLEAAWRALRASNYWWLAPSLGAFAISILLRAVRWRALFRAGRRPPLPSVTRATVIGYFFNSILPARAGEVARILALRRFAGTSRAEATGTVVVERVLDVSTLIVLLFLLLPWLPPVSWIGPAAIVAFACLGVVVVLSLLIRHLSGSRLPWWTRALSRLLRLREETAVRWTANAVHGLAMLTRPRQAAEAIAWTFFSWFMLGLSFWFLMIGFHLGLSPLAALLVVIATGLSFIIPAAPAAVGVFEAAGLAVTTAYGVPRSRGFAYVLILHVLNLLPFIVAGLAILGGEARARRDAGRAAPVRIRSRG